MGDNPLLLALITGVTGGGFITAAVAIYTAKRKVPAEVDSIIVTGAETAVVSLERTLAAETRRADRAEARCVVLEEQITRKDGRIAALEGRLDQLQSSLDATRAELHSILTPPAR